MRKITVEEIEILVTAKVNSLRPQLRKVVQEVKRTVDETKGISSDIFEKVDTKKMASQVATATKKAKEQLKSLGLADIGDTSEMKINGIGRQITGISNKFKQLKGQRGVLGDVFDAQRFKQQAEEINKSTNKVQESISGFKKYNSNDIQGFINNYTAKTGTVKKSKIDVNTTDIRKAKAEVEKINSNINKTNKNKIRVGTSKELQKSNTFANRLKNAIQQVKKQMDSSGSSSKKISNGLSSAQNTASKMAGKLKVGLGQILKMAGALFSLQSIYSTLSNVANTWLSSQNSQAKQLSANIEYMKYALGSTLAPVIQWIVNLIYQALKGVQSLIYALTGVNIFANASAKAYSNMAKSANSAKKATDSLAPGDIDEVHNIQEDRSSGGSGAGDVMPNIDLGQVNTKLNDFLKMIKEGKWYEAGKIVGNKLNEALEKIDWKTIKKKVGKVGKGIAEYLNGAIEEIDWKLTGETLAEGMNTAITFLEGFIINFNWENLSTSLYDSMKGFVNKVDWGKIVSTAIRAIISISSIKIKLILKWIIDTGKTMADDILKRTKQNGGNIAKGLWDGILEGLGNIGKWINENIVKPFVDGVKELFGIHSPSTVMAEIGQYIIEGLLQGIEEKIEELKKKITEICDNVKTWFSEKISKSKFIQTGKNVIEGVKNGIQNNSMYSTITNKCNDVKTWFSEKIASSKFVQTGKNVIEGIKEGLNNNPIYSTISGICGNVRTWFSDNLGSWNFTNIGKNVIEGIKSGMNKASTSLATTAATIASRVTGYFTSTRGFDINSPSKVMKNKVGKWIPLGIAEGIKSQAQSVYDSVYEITNGLKLNKQGLVTDISATYSKSNINSNLLSGKSIIEKATNNTNSNSGGTINFENILKLNGKTVAREIIEDLDTEARRRGYKPLLQR